MTTRDFPVPNREMTVHDAERIVFVYEASG